jgi:hypothetical protein
MVLIPSSVSKSTGKYCLMKHCMVTLPFPILKSKGKYCMAEKPSHVSRVSLSYPVEIGLRFSYDGLSLHFMILSSEAKVVIFVCNVGLDSYNKNTFSGF